MMLQVAQGVSYTWRDICRQQYLSWSRVIRGSEFISRRWLESSCPLRISKALVVRSNSAIRATGAEHSCYDLAKQLSHYLYIYFFFFFSFILDLLHRREYRKVSQVIVTWQKVTLSHHMMSHDRSHDKCRKVVHRPCSSCISSVKKSNGDSIEFSLSIAKQRAVGFIPAWSLAFL